MYVIVSSIVCLDNNNSVQLKTRKSENFSELVWVYSMQLICVPFSSVSCALTVFGLRH
ncbi:hypothetical protein B9Z19DRAFT_1085438 [Tuber borchii]|uniref:Uncharacterized protein n=1 Tax=Tuber borchii TaxID=42251 RepID=A0A2T6ZQP2_TUBBO|nr:hypothetical protein B9Z19DRAFT_1085438 [Tuber borchii]